MSEPLDQFAKAPKPLNQPEPAFGWTAYAEQINGRFAMLGFVTLLLLEFLTQQDLLTWLGLR
ncbi:MAG: chlorophyll A-B binding protein [Leptolyngbya sp.]|nr:MAG: chlorophyll A-B binding protein [Leptolyngbya sp.]